MTTNDILYVDDKDSYAKTLNRLATLRGRIRQVTPDEANQPDVQASAAAANLWVFDFFYTDDDERADIVPNMVFGGASGMTVLKSWEGFFLDARPVSMLISGHLQRAFGEAVLPQRRHVLAAEHGVDWVAPKSQQGIETGDEIAMLADASKQVRAAIRKIPDDDATDTLMRRLTALPARQNWTNASLAQISRLPMPRLSGSSSGNAADRALASTRAYLVWMLHRVLPYASFLISDRQAAVRLGITLSGLETLLTAVQETDHVRRLKKIEYQGVLKGFAGRRWWRAGIDLLVWETTNAGKGLRVELETLLKDEQAFLTVVDPVVVSDADFIETDQVASSADCVRVMDEHAPPDTLPIWVLKSEVAADKRLRARVIFEDRELLDRVDAN